MNNDEINALDEINKGASMGKDTINFIINNIKEKKLLKVLKKELKEYEKVLNKISSMYNGKPHETSISTKIMTYYGIQFRIMMDSSSSKIAELYIKGTNMGIIEGRKILNNKNLGNKVKKLVNDFVEMQELFVDELKNFL